MESTNVEMDFFQTEKYAFHLPPDQIAQNPVSPRDNSKLLILQRKSGERFHHSFADLTKFLSPGDLLVLNNTKVLAARLFGEKENTAGKVEIFLLRPFQETPHIWNALVKPGRKLKKTTRVYLPGGVTVIVSPGDSEDLRKVTFPRGYDVQGYLENFGNVPLPPYITKSKAGKTEYQTIYAKHLGSVAAPTAGLHFTPRLLEELQAREIATAFVTLHIGLGTFRPVKTEDIRNHVMHEELFEIPEATVQAIEKTKKLGGRVIAVGTTVVRSLETRALESPQIRPGKGTSSIFIYPGFPFRVIDGMITNFHLPQSTLLMLVAAFGGYEAVLGAYEEAVQKKYRFYSFGDAMMIL